MDYVELINRYWQEVDIKGWTSIETEIYFRLLDFCNRSGWRNPFTLPNPRAVALMAINENAFSSGLEQLVDKGLIRAEKDFESRNITFLFPEKVDGEWTFP